MTNISENSENNNSGDLIYFEQTAEVLANNSYWPVPIRQGEKRPFGDDWPNYQFNLSDLKTLKGKGVGIICGDVVAIDVDVRDARLVAEIRQILAAIIDDFDLSPERIGKAPKTLFVFRAAGRFTKKKTGKWVTPDGIEVEVEILAEGQQFVAHHIHPDTGRPYEWPRDSLLDVPFAELPVLDEDTADAVVSRVIDLFRSKGLQQLSTAGQRNGDGGIGEITRDGGGQVVDGRESLLAALIWKLFCQHWRPNRSDLAELIAADTWAQFSQEADLSRPNAMGRPWSVEEALYKARATIRNHPDGPPEQTAEPLYTAATGTIEESRAGTIEFVEQWGQEGADFWQRREAFDNTLPGQAGPLPPVPPVHALKNATGSGKSRAFRTTAQKLIKTKPDGTAIYGLCPTRKLFDEQANELREDLEASGFHVATYRGLDAPDPEAPGRKMCRISKFADSLRRGGADIRKLCGVENDEKNRTLCRYHAICGRQREIRAAQKADVIFAAHNHAAHPLPDGFPTPAAVAFDESPINAFLVGLDARAPKTISLDSIKAPKQIPSREGAVDYDASTDLAALKEKLVLVLDKLELKEHPAQGQVSGPIATSALAQVGITAEAAHSAYAALLRLKFEIKTSPNMNVADRKKALFAAQENMRLFLEARTWRIIARALEEGLNVLPGLRVHVEKKDHNTFKVLRLRWREEVHSDWKAAPTLLMDATAQWELYKLFWPFIDRTGSFDAAAPHMTFRQILWSAAASKLEGNGKTAANNRGRVLWYIQARAAQFKRVLVLCQKDLEERLRKMGLPDNVEIAHFNNVRGVDRWKDVDLIIVVGRTQPSPEAAEMKAEVLFGRVPERGNAWGDSTYYPKRKVGLTASERAVDMDYHPDAQAEMVRWDICEAELIQDIGRGRGVNRGPADPLQVDYIGLVPLPFPVEEALTWEEAQPSILDVCMGRGVLFSDQPMKGYWDAVAAVVPDITPSADGARKHASRGQTPNYIYPLLANVRVSGWYRHKVKPKGARYEIEVCLKGSSLLTPARQYFHEVETLEFPPCPYPKALLDQWHSAKSVNLLCEQGDL